ncbi:Multidrug resistance protein MdtG [Clarias magur]|uniref:Multidrug resistance protein MdtG n=1 Tax=Clarias magur TaxID=1594786 RepID=A0A8J4UHY5_CLAMG|nr:Multidrug resistance protein MdtG [Clarias magur]
MNASADRADMLLLLLGPATPSASALLLGMTSTTLPLRRSGWHGGSVGGSSHRMRTSHHSPCREVESICQCNGESVKKMALEEGKGCNGA